MEERNPRHDRDDSGHVDGDLELKELYDGRVHVPAPLDCLHDGVEVVVHEDDVARLPGDARSASHGETDVGEPEGWRIVCAVTCGRQCVVFSHYVNSVTCVSAYRRTSNY